MKIGEARDYYIKQSNKLYNNKSDLDKKLKDEEGVLSDEDRGVILELSNKVSDACDMTTDFLARLNELTNAMENADSTKESTDAQADATADMAKCIEIARRISSGAKVPGTDEKKLMEFSFEMYMAAKNVAALNENKSNKEYESLWEDEEEKIVEDNDIDESELPIATPDIQIQ